LETPVYNQNVESTCSGETVVKSQTEILKAAIAACLNTKQDFFLYHKKSKETQ